MSMWAYCIVSCLQLAPLNTADGFALGGTHARGLHTGRTRPTATDGGRARARSSTGRREREEDDAGDEEGERPHDDDRDIFGQPKGRGLPRPAAEDEGDIRGPDRLKSCIPYVLPLIDGDAFGRYIYERVPPLGDLHYVFFRPIVDGCAAAPLLLVGLFVLFALGPRFTGQSREVRFNAQQAILLDIALLVPNLVAEAGAEADVPRALAEPASNFVWYALATAVVYCVTSNLRGKKPDQVPFLSGVAEYAIGPY